MKGTVQETGGWDKFIRVDVGRLQLKKGKQTLAVRLTKTGRTGAFNLRAVLLEPVL